jgi:ankyrin repeat protein
MQKLYLPSTKKVKLWALGLLLIVILGAHIIFNSMSVKMHMVCAMSDTCLIPHVVRKFYIQTASKEKLQDKSYDGNLIHFVVGMWDKTNAAYHPYLEQLLNHFVEQGVNINEYSDSGFTPLLSSILTFDPVLVSLLLEKGADPGLPAKSSNEKYKDLTPLKFADLLMKNNKTDHDSLLNIKKLISSEQKSRE